MNLIQIVAPLTEPLSLEDAKRYMKVLEDDEDLDITSMIKSYTARAENYTNRQLMTATFELRNETIYDGFRLPKNPVQSIIKIEYMDLNGVYQIMSTDDYYLEPDKEVDYIWISKIPIHKKHKRAFKITFIAGYENVPSEIVSYIRLCVSTEFEHKKLVSDYKLDDSLHKFYIKLLDDFRIIPI